MANECLVTKLKGVVDNNNLPYYGQVRVKFGNVSKSLGLTFGTSGKYKAIQGAFNVYNTTGELVQSNVTEYTAYGSIVGIMPVVDNTIVVWTNKYENTISNIGYLSWQPSPDTIEGYEPSIVSLSDLNYATIITNWNASRIDFEGTLDCSTLRGNLSRLDLGCKYGQNNFKVIAHSGYKFPSTLTSLAVTSGKPGVTLRNLAELDLSCFEDCINMTNLDCALSSLVTGSIDDLCDALHTAGKVSGSVIFHCGGTLVTYKGATWDVNKAIEKSWLNTVTFTSEGWSSDWDD